VYLVQSHLFPSPIGAQTLHCAHSIQCRWLCSVFFFVSKCVCATCIFHSSLVQQRWQTWEPSSGPHALKGSLATSRSCHWWWTSWQPRNQVLESKERRYLVNDFSMKWVHRSSLRCSLSVTDKCLCRRPKMHCFWHTSISVCTTVLTVTLSIKPLRRQPRNFGNAILVPRYRESTFDHFGRVL